MGKKADKVYIGKPLEMFLWSFSECHRQWAELGRVAGGVRG